VGLLVRPLVAHTSLGVAHTLQLALVVVLWEVLAEEEVLESKLSLSYTYTLLLTPT
jgi:hypothetical protein